MTLLLAMDFTGDGKAKEPVGVGAVAAKRLEAQRLTGRSQCFQRQGAGPPGRKLEQSAYPGLAATQETQQLVLQTPH